MKAVRLGVRGQSMVVDLMAAVFVFLLVGGSMMWAWSGKVLELESQAYENERRLMAERALDTLIRSGGQPENWEALEFEGIGVIGLAKRDRVLDEGKVNRLIELAGTSLIEESLPNYYGQLKPKLLIGANDYYFRLVDAKSLSEIVEADGGFVEIGLPDQSERKIVIKRAVTFNYAREGEEKRLHEAVAELTLFSTAWGE